MFVLGIDEDGASRFTSPRSHLLVLGPPRSGKTSTLVIPNVEVFPGPVVVTSTKTDVLDAVREVRSRRGRVWLFDPSGEVTPPSGVSRARWSPVDAATSLDRAVLVVESFVRVALQSGAPGEHHWIDRAKALLAPVWLAAHLGGLSASDSARWIDLRDVSEAIDILAFEGQQRAGEILGSVLDAESRERSAIFSSTSAALGAYRFGDHGAEGEAFCASDFIASQDCLCVVAPSLVQQVVAPIVVCLIEEIRTAAYQRSVHGSLPESKVAFILDEMANIAPLPSLGSLLSEGASQGVVLLGALQDLSQARSRWPGLVRGLFTLFGTTVVLGGIGDLETLRGLEELFGQRDEVEVQLQEVEGVFGGRRSRSWRHRRAPILDRYSLSQLKEGEAAVLDLRGESGRIRLRPFYEARGLR
ncbi:MAG: type IV secretory system conjugative DNA transfer family protein [Ferrimicrobium sp.]